MDNLRFIRETMERAGPFTAVPGWGGVVIGGVRLAAAPLAGPADGMRWLAAWLAAAVVSVVVGLAAIARKARASNAPFIGAPLQRFALAYVPPLAAGAVLTPVFAANGLTTRLPGCWLLLYGTALVARRRALGARRARDGARLHGARRGGLRGAGGLGQLRSWPPGSAVFTSCSVL